MSSGPLVARPWISWLSGGALACVLLLGACRRQEEVSGEKAPAPEAESFSFVVPTEFVVAELRGEGSERMRAPGGHHVERTAFGFRVEAGPDFAVDIVPDAAPQLGTPPGVSRVSSEPDVSVFKAPSGDYSFVVMRELVPEWDETARQRFACGSAGAVMSGAAPRADRRGFSKAATEQMVAACRTLELPALD